MHNEFTAIVEQDGPWHIAYCAEVPGANGQGRSREECLANLREAIALILDTGARNRCAPCLPTPSRNSL
jgi:predicted RNase H-like HicB family nuclease